ncbi:MAG: MATE family efflux transporter [Peptostreptococcaceae bacterium]|nr:MATE family efflux transporter [Peptostreptococcaceae bacterium]MDY5739024.1 MATE family efflux transporter [Anaerovoracaceae bacterium]
MRNNEQTLILEGNIWKMMWTLSWPAIVAMVLYGLNVFIDGIFVGQFIGETALGGITLVYPITQILNGVGTLIGVGAGSYLSILIGKKDFEKQHRLMGNVNYLILISSAIVTVLGIITMPYILNFLGAKEAEYAYSKDYITTVLFGSIFWIAGLAYNMIVRAEGRMKTAAFMMGTGLVANVILNYIFVAILHWGVIGIALGTNIGMLIYTLQFIVYMARKKASFESNYLSLKRVHDDKKQIMSLGFPSLLMSVMYVIQMFVIMYSLKTYGVDSDVSFYGAVFRLFNLFLTPIYGLMRALQPAIGINFGAGHYKRVSQSFKLFAFVAALIMLPFWAVAMLKPDFMMHMSLPDRVFTDIDVSNFRFMLGLCPVLPAIFMAMTYWPAVGNAKPAAILGISRQLFLYIPAMLILPKLFGVSWLYKGSFVIDLAIIVIVLTIVLKELKVLCTKEKALAVNSNNL